MWLYLYGIVASHTHTHTQSRKHTHQHLNNAWKVSLLLYSSVHLNDIRQVKLWASYLQGSEIKFTNKMMSFGFMWFLKKSYEKHCSCTPGMHYQDISDPLCEIECSWESWNTCLMLWLVLHTWINGCTHILYSRRYTQHTDTIHVCSICTHKFMTLYLCYTYSVPHAHACMYTQTTCILRILKHCTLNLCLTTSECCEVDANASTIIL